MTKRKFSKNLIIVLVLLLLFGAIVGFVVKFRNQDSEKVSTFSVRVNDTLTSTDLGGFIVTKSNPLNVSVLFPANTSNDKMAYEYSVVFSSDNSFKYYANYEEHTWGDSSLDVYSCLEVSLESSGLIITPKENTVMALLRLLCPGKDIYLLEDTIDYSKDLFSLRIKSASGEIIVIGFGFEKVVTTITLDVEEIIF